MQTTKTKNNRRERHVWYYRRVSDDWKCVLCGAVTKEPVVLEANNEMPDKYEKLTDDERGMSPQDKSLKL